MILLLACVPAPEPGITFVRDGVLHADGRVESLAWRPGDRVFGEVAPRIPGCGALFHVELEDRRREAAMGVPPPGASLAFSPDGGRLAIGSVGGTLLVVDAFTGEERARRQLPEASAKRVGWSPDGQTLYVGEQSPDALLHALDPATLEPRWTRRLADDLDTSVLPPKDDIYGMYSLPAAYAVDLLPDGSLIVAGAHGWNDRDGKRHNRSRLYHLGPTGELLAAWPPEGPVDGVMLNPSVHAGRVLVGLSRSADGPPPPGMPIGGLLRFDLPGLQPRWSRTFAPLAPHFTEVFMWDAVGLGAQFGVAGLGDGRLFVLADGDGAIAQQLDPGVPIDRGGVPISTGVGFSEVSGGRAWFLTTGTNIPWGSADPSARPPSPHPAQNTVHALELPGRTLWERQLDHVISGVHLAPDGAALLVGGSTRDTDVRTDLFGALLLDPGTGETITWCPTAGPVDFRPAWAPDSRRIAVAEAPYAIDGDVRGTYRVTVLR